jgi:hypothetical protein
MDEEPDWAADDPEIAALLTFTPVPRGVERADGWGPASQRGFIAWLAATGNVIAAARAVARSESGAKQLRREDERGEFAAAWARAIALYRSRNGAMGQPKPVPPPVRPPEPEAPEDEDEAWQELCDGIFAIYLKKLQQERKERLNGRIVAADFYVRQLIWVEVMLDLAGYGEQAFARLRGLTRGDLEAGDIVATPVSILLDHLRRAFWAELDGLERPPLPALGLRPAADATAGATPEWEGIMTPEKRAADERQQALQAEAQMLWEAKARAEVVAWRTRQGLPPLEDGGADRPDGGEA